MADLDFLQRSNPVQVVGGDETFPADVSVRKELSVSDTIKEAIVSAGLTVGTTAIEIRAGASRLINRKGLMLFNNSTQTLFWGASGVTTSTGVPLARGESVNISVENVAIFVVGSQAGQNARIIEYR